MIGLQAAAGNQAVCALLGAQAKLEVGPADDPLEREADAVASQVVQALRTPGGRHRPVGGGVAPRGQIARSIQRRSHTSPGPIGAEGGEVAADLERTLSGARGSGEQLPTPVRTTMEGAFGADFGRVRLHTGSAAGTLGEQMGAKAFTLGNDIFFRAGLPDGATQDGQHLIAHELAHTVQQGSAAPTTAARVMREPEEGSEAPSSAPKGAAEEEEEEESEAEAVEATGTLPPIEESLIDTSPPSGMVADRSSTAGVSSPPRRREARPSSVKGPSTHRIHIGGLDVVDSDREVSAPVAEGMEDKITSSVGVSSSTAGGRTVTAFGAMGPDLAFDDQTYAIKVPKAKKAKKGATPAPSPEGTVSVNFTLRFDCTWGTINGGRTDVPSADSAVVTEDTYEQIVSDLTPALIEKSWRAPRNTYWSEAICARHEKYHATDARKWVSSQGKKFLVNYLNKKTVTLNDDQRKDLGQVKTQMETVMNDARSAFIQAYVTYMNGTGLTYLSYPSEERAFGDGKKPYLSLAAAVDKKGKAKKKAAAKAGSGVTAPTGSGTG